MVKSTSNENNGRSGSRCYGGVHGGEFAGFARMPRVVLVVHPDIGARFEPLPLPAGRLIRIRSGAWVRP